MSDPTAGQQQPRLVRVQGNQSAMVERLLTLAESTEGMAAQLLGEVPPVALSGEGPTPKQPDNCWVDASDTTHGDGMKHLKRAEVAVQRVREALG